MVTTELYWKPETVTVATGVTTGWWVTMWWDGNGMNGERAMWTRDGRIFRPVPPRESGRGEER